jgi:hypothetical protein
VWKSVRPGTTAPTAARRAPGREAAAIALSTWVATPRSVSAAGARDVGHCRRAISSPAASLTAMVVRRAPT